MKKLHNQRLHTCIATCAQNTVMATYAGYDSSEELSRVMIDAALEVEYENNSDSNKNSNNKHLNSDNNKSKNRTPTLHNQQTITAPNTHLQTTGVKRIRKRGGEYHHTQKVMHEILCKLSRHSYDVFNCDFLVYIFVLIHN